MMRGLLVGHRRVVKDGHWIPHAEFLIGNDSTLTKKDNDNIYPENWKKITHSQISID